MTPVASAKKRRKFDLRTFLSTIDDGRTIAAARKEQTIFAQGDSADSVYYIQKGKVRLTVVSKSGKEATIGVLDEGDLFWRRLPYRTACSFLLGNRNDRLHGDANR
jgi:CRP/FNR family transcriptional regulator, cyclic AMP receptor protein